MGLGFLVGMVVIWTRFWLFVRGKEEVREIFGRLGFFFVVRGVVVVEFVRSRYFCLFVFVYSFLFVR